VIVRRRPARRALLLELKREQGREQEPNAPAYPAHAFGPLNHHGGMSHRFVPLSRLPLRKRMPSATSALVIAALCAPMTTTAQSLMHTMANTRPSAPLVSPPLQPPVRMSEIKQALQAFRSDVAETGQTLVQAVTPSSVTTAVKPIPKSAPTARPALLSEQDNTGRAERAVRLGELSRLLELPLVLTMEPGKASASVSVDSADLKSVARLGLAHSLEVEAARQRLETFGHTRDAARGALLPRADLRMAVGKGALVSTEPHLHLQRQEYTATMRQALVDEPARRELKRQGVLTDSAELQLGGAASNALLESAGAWLAVLQSRVAVQLGIEYTSLLDELSRYITERAAAGGASPADRERVRGRVANVRAGMADANAALKVATRNLNRLTGTVPASISLSFPASEFTVPAEREGARDLALLQNFELLAARAEVVAAEVEGDIARSRFLPRMELELTHSRTTNSGGQENFSRDTRGMVVLSVPLANGGTDLAQVRASKSRRNELQAKASNVERKLSLELETAYANLEASAQRYSAVRDELEANAKVVAAFKAQMLGSNRSLLEVLDAFQRLHQSRLDLTQSLVSEAQSQLRVAHLTGALATVFSAAP
jgi:outer membrane protein TolC